MPRPRTTLRLLLLVLFFLSLFVPSIAHGQTLTTVTGVITDPQGFIYTGARITVTLNGTTGTVRTTPCPGNNQAPGCAVQLPSPFFTDALTGKFTINLWANAGITCTPTACAGTTYTFTVDSYNATANPPIGTGPQHFAVSGITVAGSSQDLSSTLSAAAPSLTNINPASVTGCGLPAGGLTGGVLLENPKGTCFDSAVFTWNPSTYQLQSGFENTFGTNVTQSKLLGDVDTICNGSFNPSGGCINVYTLGTSNNLTGSSQTVLGDDNTTQETVAAGSYPTGVYILGSSNTARSVSGSGVEGLFVLGSNNLATSSNSGQIVSSTMVGDQNTLTSSQNLEEIVSAFIVGHQNAINSTTGSGNYSEIGSFGSFNTLNNCSDCYAIGENASVSSSHFLGLGLSATPELQITPSAVTTSPASTFTVGNLTPGTFPICPNGTGGALTTTGCSGGGGGGGVGGNTLLYANATAVAAAASTSEQTLMQYTVPANTISTIGQDLRIRAAGNNNNASGGNITYTYRMYVDSTVIATSANTEPVTGDKNTFWAIDADAVFSAVGSGGSASADGTVIFQVNNNGFNFPATNGPTNVTVAFNTTTTHTVKVTVQMSTASASALPTQDRMTVDLDSGSAISVNGAAVPNPNFNSTTPAAPGGDTNCTFQVSGSSVSCYVPSASLPSGVAGQSLTNNGGGGTSYSAASPTYGVANGGALISLASANYSILCDSSTVATGIQDRGKDAKVGTGGANSVVVPDLAGTGCGGMYGSITNSTSGSITVSRQTSDTFNVFGPSQGAPTTGATTFTLAAGQWATYKPSESATAYDIHIYAPVTAAPAAAVSNATSTPVTVSTSNNSEYYNNQNATAATAVTFNLPTAAAGKQFCFTNSYNGSAADTGVLTLQTSATGQFIIFTDGTLSATDGNVTSGGAAGDAACVVGVDSTHWQLYVQRGTWTKH